MMLIWTYTSLYLEQTHFFTLLYTLRTTYKKITCRNLEVHSEMGMVLGGGGNFILIPFIVRFQ